MILVIYNEDNEVLETFQDVSNPVVDGASVAWDGGGLVDIKHPFLILDDNADVSDYVTNELIALDKKKEFIKVDVTVEELRILKKRQDETENTILFLMDISLMGGMM